MGCGAPWSEGNACQAEGDRVLASDGFWLMLHPLPPGTYRLRVTGGDPMSAHTVNAEIDLVVAD